MSEQEVYKICYTVYGSNGTEYIELFYYATCYDEAFFKGNAEIRSKYTEPSQLTALHVIDIKI